MRRFLSAWAVAAALALSATLAAQQVTSARINGTVTDETHAPVPGVTVTLTSPALQVPQRTTVTDNQGEYQFLELPVGTYRVSFELSGFSRLVREDIQLAAGFAARVDAGLKLSGVQETVTVSGQSPIVDVTNTRGGAVLSKTLLDSVPNNLNYNDIQNLTPGLVVAAPPQPGQLGSSALGNGFKSYGMSAGQQRTSIEGIDMQTNETPDFSSLEEVDVKTFGNSAEIPTPGAAVQLIVKSGGNQFHGQYKEQYMTHHLQATNIDDALQKQGIHAGDALVFFQDFAGDLGGRVVRDKLWFYGAVRDQHNERTLTGYVSSPGGDGIFGTADDIPGNPPVDNLNLTSKLSYQATSKNRFIGFYTRDKIHEDQLFASRFTPQESTLQFDYRLYQSKIEWQGTLGSRLYATAMVGDGWYHSIYFNPPAALSKPATMDLTTQWQSGESFNGLDQNRRLQERKQSNGSLSYQTPEFLGSNHELKVGYGLWFWQNPIDILSKPSGNYQLVYDNGNPTQINTVNNPVSFNGILNTYSGYVADLWRPTKSLTVNLGLRFDREVSYDPAGIKDQGQFGTSGTFPRVDTGSWSVWAPRFGAALDLTGDGKTVVKGTYGRYNYVLPSNYATNFSLIGQVITTFRWHDLNLDKKYQPGEVNLDPNGPDFVSVAGNQGRDTSAIVNPDLQLPRTHEVTASVEREVTPSLSVRGLYVYKLTASDYQAVNIARPFGVYNIPISRQDPGPDGVTGTADDGGVITLYDYDPAYRGAKFVVNEYQNRPSNRNDHTNSIEFTLNKRQQGKWSGETSFLATKYHRYIVGIPQSPNDQVFDLDTTWELTYRLAGTFRAPYGIDLSGFYTAFNGVVGQRTYLFRSLPQLGTFNMRMEPFGAERGPVRSNVNVRAAKAFALARGRQLKAEVDVVNVFNSNAPWAITYTSGPTFGYVNAGSGVGGSLTPPRVLRFGATFSF